MENINHLNSEYYGLPSYGYKKTKINSEKQSTLLALIVVVIFSIMTWFVS